MEEIQSIHNNLVRESKKLLQKKYRDKLGKYLVEGIRLVEEACKSDSLEVAFYDDSLLLSIRGQDLINEIKNKCNVYKVDYKVLKELVETDSPQGIVGVVAKKEISLANLSKGVLVVADGLQDPGNLGTIIRTAWAAGAKALVCLSGTVDPYNGKTIRATMGGIFHLPVLTKIQWTDMYMWCCKNNYKLVAGDISAQENYFSLNYENRTALIIGSEGHGLVNVEVEQVDYLVKIPLLNGAESLNAAVACGILLYEMLRQQETSK